MAVAIAASGISMFFTISRHSSTLTPALRNPYLLLRQPIQLIHQPIYLPIRRVYLPLQRRLLVLGAGPLSVQLGL